MSRILVVDNYDSFVYTLVGYLQQLGAETDVRRNDAVTPDAADDYDGVLISPGPGTPERAGVSVEMIRHAGTAGIPLFGVCLGLQSLAVAYGATVAHAPYLMHGKTSEIHHDGRGVFADLPDPFPATRYHSLAVVPETVPDELEITARTSDGIVMGLQHRTAPLHTVQFHPESVLTGSGYLLLGNWLAMAGLPDAPERAKGLAPLVLD